MKGLEPIHNKALPPQSSLSTNSNTCAKQNVVQPGLEPRLFWTKTKRVAITLLDSTYIR